ncbi:putative DNA polymerase III epsilon subunit [Hoyosella rhizosphaerae]|uniref:DNA polymerase III epsilon subunit n=1 Tax=Hoyosella rhizosphaerae TaxID=1755582 RepID=A0A916UEZ7_9ACTN|nr:putative DNA polymerase III epsilon subunit [Hoyosella rhizosphaerae]
MVVDLETTGGSAQNDRITEIGAVKIRGGEVIGEFATLVNPEQSIPAYIVQLTGITTTMVSKAPTINEVLPAFFEFAQSSTLIAHNAGFDVGFLKASAQRLDFAWPFPAPLCTVKLARRVLTKDEAPSVKLSKLALLFRIPHTPTHRALDDARATVDVFHALLERIGNQGIHTLSELNAYMPNIPTAVRVKRSLADSLPDGPGVYMFRGPSEEILYVGKATNLSSRVRSYFTGSETRKSIREMVNIAERVDHITCAHSLEAGVRELRLIAATEPAYNKRSKWPQRSWWINLTDEAFPRFTISHRATTNSFGPFSRRSIALENARTLAEATGLRTCLHRIPAQGTHSPDCLSHSPAPCAAAQHGELDTDAYRALVEHTLNVLTGFDCTPLERLQNSVHTLASQERFESAARMRDKLSQLGVALHKSQRARALAAMSELVVGKPDGHGGWELAVIRYGTLAASGVARKGTSARALADSLVATAESVIPTETPLAGVHPEEIYLIIRWLDEPGVRIVHASPGYSEPAHSATKHLSWFKQAQDGARIDKTTLAQMPRASAPKLMPGVVYPPRSSRVTVGP